MHCFNVCFYTFDTPTFALIIFYNNNLFCLQPVTMKLLNANTDLLSHEQIHQTLHL